MGATTNFNHINQTRKTKEISTNEVGSSTPSIIGKETHFSKLSKNLIDSNNTMSKIQLLDESLDKLEGMSNSLYSLAVKYQKDEDKIFVEDEFNSSVERMLDVVENTIYEGRQLFSNEIFTDSKENVLHVSELIESIDISNGSSVSMFKKEISEVKSSLILEKNNQQLVVNNTLAAMNSKDVTLEAVKGLEDRVDTTYKKSFHVVPNIKNIDSLL